MKWRSKRKNITKGVGGSKTGRLDDGRTANSSDSKASGSD